MANFVKNHVLSDLKLHRPNVTNFRPPLARNKKKLTADEESIDLKESGILENSSKNLRIPRHLLEDEKELFSMISREVLQNTDVPTELTMSDVIGMVSFR